MSLLLSPFCCNSLTGTRFNPSNSFSFMGSISCEIVGWSFLELNSLGLTFSFQYFGLKLLNLLKQLSQQLGLVLFESGSICLLEDFVIFWIQPIALYLLFLVLRSALFAIRYPNISKTSTPIPIPIQPIDCPIGILAVCDRRPSRACACPSCFLFHARGAKMSRVTQMSNTWCYDDAEQKTDRPLMEQITNCDKNLMT